MLRLAVPALLLLPGAGAAADAFSAAQILQSCGGLQMEIEVAGGGGADNARRIAGILSERLDPFPAMDGIAVARDDGVIVLSNPQGVLSRRDLIALRPLELSLHAVDPVADEAAGGVLELKEAATGEIRRLAATPVVGPGDFAAAEPSEDASGRPALWFRTRAGAAKRMGDWTSANVGRRIAAVLDGRILMTATIASPILGGTGYVTGLPDPEAVAMIARAAALPPLDAELLILSERAVDADPAADGPCKAQD